MQSNSKRTVEHTNDLVARCARLKPYPESYAAWSNVDSDEAHSTPNTPISSSFSRKYAMIGVMSIMPPIGGMN